MTDSIKKIKDNFKRIEQYGSPVYLYDYNILKDRCNQMYEFKEYLENKIGNVKVTMHYSSKANSNPAILKAVKDAGLFVDCMSPLELYLNQKCGFSKEEILYVCNNISADEMKMVHENDLLICLDSISQVETWGKMYPNTDIMIRINPGTTGVGHSYKVITSGKATKFGVSEDNFEELFKTANKYNLKIVGVHQHLGSLFLNNKINYYIGGVRAGLELIKTYFKDVTIVDLGGGFGVPYQPDENNLDLMKVANQLEKILIKFKQEYPSVKEFKFEPGRFIPCESGYLLGTVTAVKHENDTWWIGTDIGMNELVRPSMYDSYHEISFLGDDSEEEIIANICGNVCESGDVLGKDRKIKLPKVGDRILVHNAGAYGYSMASNYTGRPRPAEVMIYDDKIQLIRRAETIEIMESNIIWE